MPRSRSASKRRAQRLGRPKPRARLVEVRGEAYEVLDLPDGGRKVFRLELLHVEPESPEFNLVESQIRADEFRARQARGEVKPGEPRPVPPHRPGRAL